MSELHTPTPWHTVESDPLDHTLGQKFYKTLKIGSGRGTLDTEPFHIVADAGYSKSIQVKLNAAFIVRACNLHAELVEALDDVLSMLDEWDSGFTKPGEEFRAVTEARSVLVKARGE